MTHPAIIPGRVAVVTGAASGIGLAAAQRLSARGMAVVMADLPGEALEREAAALAAAGATVVAQPTDVTDRAQVDALREAAFRLGSVSLLMNNAGQEVPCGFDAGPAVWRTVLETNLWGAVNGVQSFLPAMRDAGTPGAIVNTGSKQGITNPPGNTAYNVSKSALKALTEGLAHDLLSTALTAHLLIPGFTFTGFTRKRTDTKPDGAWTPEQVVAFMLDGMARGDFYILCPDNDTTRAMDEKRMRWAMDDVILNRPALSRWHPDHEAAFKAFMAG